MHGDDFTFGGTDSKLKKIKSNMCEWYDEKVRGILGHGRRDVQKIEMLLRTLRWTEHGLEYEVGDEHRKAESDRDTVLAKIHQEKRKRFSHCVLGLVAHVVSKASKM